MKLLERLQIKPVVKTDPKSLNVDYTQYGLGTAPLLDDNGNLFFWVDNPLTRAEKNIMYSTELDTTQHTMHIQQVHDSKQWLKENMDALTARFVRVELPTSTVVRQIGLRGMYRMAKTQIDNVVELSGAVLRNDASQYVKPVDVYSGLTDYAFKAMIANYYIGHHKEELEQSIEQIKTLGKYPDDWYPIDVRAVKNNVEVRKRLNERFVHVYDNDPHYIRLCASLIAGLKTVPVELTYHGGSERNVQGIWNPNCILSMYGHSILESHEEKVSA